MFTKFKTSMMNEFEITDLGKMHYFLGTKLIEDTEGQNVDSTHFKQIVGSLIASSNSKKDTLKLEGNHRSCSAAVAWSSKKQPVVTLSTAEAEFIVVASCACQAVWLRRLLNELHCSQYESTLIYYDNNLAIKLSKIQVMHRRSKNIDVRFHFLQKLTKKEVVYLVHCRTQEQVANILTKPMKLDDFRRMHNSLRVCLSSDVN
ncbi:unnamed protein product [Prunus armeniaca]